MRQQLLFDEEYDYFEQNESVEVRDPAWEYFDKLVVNEALNRAIVSFQANKKVPVYRWYKFKEGYSTQLVEYCLNYAFESGTEVEEVLDPFSGTGTTVTRSAEHGYTATGVEILPVANAVTKARIHFHKANADIFRQYLSKLRDFDFSQSTGEFIFPHIRITKGAFSKKTEKALSAFHDFLQTIEDETTRYLFWFAIFTILEKVSYTRKDGQYLRWDHRALRQVKSSFEKSKVYEFEPALFEKLDQMLNDIVHHQEKERNLGEVNLIEGSSLRKLTELPDNTFDIIITSPPYCNRYDYTRTYALELAYMGYNDEAVKSLRQELLSATVENKSKYDELYEFYQQQNKLSEFQHVEHVFSSNVLLNEALEFLEVKSKKGELNNKNVVSMVYNYFFEMCFIIKDISKALASNGRVFMVNDNVQYAGQAIPVDFILSNFAHEFGLEVEKIWVLPNGKGNSSQQMGKHGRNEIRKCVYIWKKTGDQGFNGFK